MKKLSENQRARDVKAGIIHRSNGKSKAEKREHPQKKPIWENGTDLFLAQ
jgi:outer membrane phospholipase A